jgi:hypothetical protein
MAQRGARQSIPFRRNSNFALERLGQPQDIAAAVAFLVGPDGAWINGQVLAGWFKPDHDAGLTRGVMRQECGLAAQAQGRSQAGCDPHSQTTPVLHALDHLAHLRHHAPIGEGLTAYAMLDVQRCF